MMEKMVQTAKQTVKAMVETQSARVCSARLTPVTVTMSSAPFCRQLPNIGTEAPSIFDLDQCRKRRGSARSLARRSVKMPDVAARGVETRAFVRRASTSGAVPIKSPQRRLSADCGRSRIRAKLFVPGQPSGAINGQRRVTARDREFDHA